MALDAPTLALTAAELKQTLADARIDRIFQPTRDEVLITMRTRRESHKLLVSARTGSARVCLTGEGYENPASPPSFCMLLRKHLGGGRLLDIRTEPGERIVFFEFLCTNEMGDLLTNTLAAELMGRYCNIVLLRGRPVLTPGLLPGQPAELAARDEAGEPVKILDALKRVDFEDSQVRQLLPGLAYTLPPKPDKIDLMAGEPAALLAAMAGQDAPVSAALRRLAGGVAPVVVREVAYRAFGSEDPPADRLAEHQRQAFCEALRQVRAVYAAGGVPNLARHSDGRPAEYSFTPLTQYEPACEIVRFDGFSALLEGYYAEKDRTERLRQRSKELRKTVANLYERALRKQAARTEELAESEQSDHLRITGELLTANLHSFQKGDGAVTLLNWYTGEEETVRLDPRLSPSANAQRYFREYKKKQTARAMLAKLLAEGEREIEYLSTVLYEVDAAEGEAALGEIRAELKGQGYLRYYKQRDKRHKPAAPLRYTSSDGFAIYVGRNNAQNERLTLKTARGKDMWFHVKGAPGSHVVVMSEGRDIPLATQNEAAMLAVWHSGQRASAKVPVDYTMVKNIRKTGDLPPGMVLYEHYETAYVTADEAVVEKLLAAE